MNPFIRYITEHWEEPLILLLFLGPLWEWLYGRAKDRREAMKRRPGFEVMPARHFTAAVVDAKIMKRDPNLDDLGNVSSSISG